MVFINQPLSATMPAISADALLARGDLEGAGRVKADREGGGGVGGVFALAAIQAALRLVSPAQISFLTTQTGC